MEAAAKAAAAEARNAGVASGAVGGTNALSAAKAENTNLRKLGRRHFSQKKNVSKTDLIAAENLQCHSKRQAEYQSTPTCGL